MGRNEWAGNRTGMSQGALSNARQGYLEFLRRCAMPDGKHRLTPASEPTAFATCFWIFGMRLLRQDDLLEAQRDELVDTLRCAVREARKVAAKSGRLESKPYRQLLAFSLSALSILRDLAQDPLVDLVDEQLPKSVDRELQDLGCLSGRPQSGNQAMFLAVFLLHARDYLGRAVDAEISAWTDAHLRRMNPFGFWGGGRNMTTLQFQNGYHQYEIFEYLGVHTGKERKALSSVAGLADGEGHFAPYPGGGGCFDYDAVFMLTPDGLLPEDPLATLLQRTFSTLLSEQLPDGGFCENLYVRPRSPRNVLRGIGHVLSALPNSGAFMERLRYALALQRTRYDRIATHWSEYSRAWDESDLWDSWFRMLAMARIQCAFEPGAVTEWGFINYPGIGFHPSLRCGA